MSNNNSKSSTVLVSTTLWLTVLKITFFVFGGFITNISTCSGFITPVKPTSSYYWVVEKNNIYHQAAVIRSRDFQLQYQIYYTNEGNNNNANNNNNNINDENDIAPSNGKRENTNVRTILKLLTDHFTDDNTNNNIVVNTTEWKKTRSYLYRVVSSSSSSSSSDRINKRKIERVLAFLEETFPNNKQLQRRIVQTCPRIFSKSVGTNLQPTVHFLKELYGPILFQEAVRRNPMILLVSGMGYNDDNELNLIEIFLKEELQLKQNEITKLKSTAPYIFQLSIVHALSNINYFKGLLTQARYSEVKTQQLLRKLIVSHPQILQLSVENNLKPSIDFLIDRCQLSVMDVPLLLRTAGIIGLSIEDNLKPKINFLSTLLPNPNDMKKVILSHPAIIGLSLQNINAKVTYFDAIDQISGTNKILLSNPRNSCTSTKRLRKTVNNTNRLASRILLRSPAVYSLSLKENIIPTINYLSYIWGFVAPIVEWDGKEILGISTGYPSNAAKKVSKKVSTTRKNTLASMIGEYPAILTLSLEGNIQPTIEFYNQTGYIKLPPKNEITTTTTNNRSMLTFGGSTHLRGRYIAASLFNRLLPRYHLIMSSKTTTQQQQQNQVNDDPLMMTPSSLLLSDISKSFDQQSTQPKNTSSLSVPLHTLVTATDIAFCEYYNINYTEYCNFKVVSVPRIKFYSQFHVWLNTGRPIDI